MDGRGFRWKLCRGCILIFIIRFIPFRSKPAFQGGACFHVRKRRWPVKESVGKDASIPFSLPFHPSVRKSKWTVQLPTFSKLKMDAGAFIRLRESRRFNVTFGKWTRFNGWWCAIEHLGDEILNAIRCFYCVDFLSMVWYNNFLNFVNFKNWLYEIIRNDFILKKKKKR